MMSAETIMLTTKSQAYDKTPENKDEVASSKKTLLINPSPQPPSNGPLTIEKPSFDTILHPPKSTILKKISILVLELLNFIMLLNIWLKHPMLCPRWKYSKAMLHNTRIGC